MKIQSTGRGPLTVHGAQELTLVDDEGNVIDLGDKDVISLCGCGDSENGPLCDGSHKVKEFKTAR